MSRMQLGAVQSGRLDKPKRVLLYGSEGVGKSTFGAGAPSPIFLGAEDGTAQLDVARFPEPETWQDALDAIEQLITEDHEYQTLVIDTLDWLEPLCWAHVCAEGKKPSIEDFGYGKGYVAALDQWRVFFSALDRLRGTKQMGIVLLAHSHIRTFRNPEGEDFDRYELKLNTKAAGLCKEWPDAVLFTQYETFTHEKNERVKGVSTGARIVHTERRAAFDAKNRYGLPPAIPLGWADFEAAIGNPGKADELHATASELIAALEDAADAKKAADGLKRADGDAGKLSKLIDWINARIETTTRKAS